MAAELRVVTVAYLRRISLGNQAVRHVSRAIGATDWTARSLHTVRSRNLATLTTVIHTHAWGCLCENRRVGESAMGVVCMRRRNQTATVYGTHSLAPPARFCTGASMPYVTSVPYKPIACFVRFEENEHESPDLTHSLHKRSGNMAYVGTVAWFVAYLYALPPIERKRPEHTLV